MLRDYLPYVGKIGARDRWKKLISQLQKKASPVIVLWLLIGEVIKSVVLWRPIEVVKVSLAIAVFVLGYIFWDELQRTGEKAKEKVKEKDEEKT